MATREIRKIRLMCLLFTLGMTSLFLPSFSSAQVPEYGGTFTYIMESEPPHTDPHLDYRAAKAVSGVAEKLGIAKWAVDRSEYDFLTYEPEPGLAESWELLDSTTYVFHIRQDVNWYIPDSTNGPQLTSRDILYNWERILDPNQGEQRSVWDPLESLQIESVNALDDWTVEFRLEEPSITALSLILTSDVSFILPPEVIRQQNDVTDWRNLIGTGPYRLIDWTEENSITWERNPNYWGIDTSNSQNCLPCIEQLIALIIPDEATRLAAINTREVDYIPDVSDDTIDQIRDLQQWNFIRKLGRNFFDMNATREPFDDIRVRAAMQMAIDLETINRTYSSLVPTVSPFQVEGVGRENYSYDPERARQLMAEAGYPNGFWTNLRYDEEFDRDVIDLFASNLANIGIKIESEAVNNVWNLALQEPYNDGGIFMIRGTDSDPLYPWVQLQASLRNKDLVFDSIIQAPQTSAEERQGLFREAYERIREKSWYVESNYYITNIIRSRINGYDTDQIFLKDLDNSIFAHFWIDQEQ